MTKKVKKTKKNGIADENSVDEKVKAVAEENVNVNEENIGTPSYEELLDTKEDLEQALLRANADLDNAIKRTLTDVIYSNVRVLPGLLLLLVLVVHGVVDH